MTELYVLDVTPLEDRALYDSFFCTVRLERQERILKLRQAADRRRALGAELLLGYALKLRGVTEFTLSCGAHGKPYLDGVQGLYFNLSHAGEYAICAISDREIGCDIERIDPQINLGIADRFFTPEEAEWMRAEENASEQVERFFRLWTLKESLMKATGLGFSLSPRTFSFAFCEGLPTLIQEKKMLTDYTFFENFSVSGYCMALCMAGKDDSYTMHHANFETLC